MWLQALQERDARLALLDQLYEVQKRRYLAEKSVAAVLRDSTSPTKSPTTNLV